MTRNLKSPALVLKVNPVGENHRGLSMLVRGEGLLRPLAYGAQGKRSTLRASALPYNRGIADLHFDGAKNSWRLVSFDVQDSHEGLREDLDRFYTAATWAEILLKTHGAGGDSAALFDMASSAFSLLSVSTSGNFKRLHLGFLWKFLEIEGVQPTLNTAGNAAGPCKSGEQRGRPGFCPTVCSSVPNAPNPAGRYCRTAAGGG
ncbi:MAG: hypothetical protein DRP49_05495 [Spirochaetes bacterium]|nr:MAG: hypothetical protein DRP49_05495 [Spirochaetota bacterium]